MGCRLSFGNNKPRIEIIDQIPKRKEFDYLRPKGEITYSINKTCMSLELKLILMVGT